MNFIAVGNPIPCMAQLGLGDTDKFVRARVFGIDGDEIAGSPILLTHLARGLYYSNALDMPSQEVTVQAEAFNDAGFTDPCDMYIAAQTFGYRENIGGGLYLNQVIPITAQLGNGDNDKYLRSWLYDSDGVELIGSPVDLTLVEDGLYQNSSILMPDTTNILVQTQAFSDSDYTVPTEDYIQALIISSAYINAEDEAACPDYTISIGSFKQFFARDFPYGNTPDKVMNTDIKKALDQAVCFLNRNLFCDEGVYNMNVLLLAAHFLVMNLRASSQGVSGSYAWLTASKSVGSVAQSFSIPDRILQNPELSMLSQTNYGSQVLFNVLPLLSGNVFVVAGDTLP